MLQSCHLDLNSLVWFPLLEFWIYTVRSFIHSFIESLSWARKKTSFWDGSGG